MALDFSVHLLIVSTLGCRYERNPPGMLGQLLRVPALPASHAS
jgi:hypothetical protein